jgi:hypothetical protein
MNPVKYFFMLLTYLWLRFDLILYLAFRKNWTPRYQFLSSIFGEKEAEKFLRRRMHLVKTRSKKKPPVILPSMVDKKTQQFLTTNPNTKNGRAERKEIIALLLFWATDTAINQYNIESYKTRSAITDNLLNMLFQNALTNETEKILDGLKKIVFSRVTYLGAKGEPSPVVHDVIISGVGRLLTFHYNEVVRQRDEKLDKLTKIKLIKEIKKADKDTGSLAFSGTAREKDEFKHQFPLETKYAKLLLKILNHYRFSAWPESRERAEKLIQSMEKQLGFKLEEAFLK